MVDAVQNGNFAFIKANSKKHARVDQPKPVERPQDATKRKKSNPATNKFAAMARMAYKAGKKNRKDA